MDSKVYTRPPPFGHTTHPSHVIVSCPSYITMTMNGIMQGLEHCNNVFWLQVNAFFRIIFLLKLPIPRCIVVRRGLSVCNSQFSALPGEGLSLSLGKDVARRWSIYASNG